MPGGEAKGRRSGRWRRRERFFLSSRGLASADVSPGCEEVERPGQHSHGGCAAPAGDSRVGPVRGTPMPKKTGAERRPRRGPSADRKRRLKAIREQIRQGAFDDDDKLRVALDRMIDRLLERSRR